MGNIPAFPQEVPSHRPEPFVRAVPASPAHRRPRGHEWLWQFLSSILGYLYAHESLALGPKDEPLVAFVAYDHDDLNTSALYFVAYDADTCTWKPPVMVDRVEDLDDNVPLRVAASLLRSLTDTGTSVWFSSSPDGKSWSAPVELPKDGGDSMGTYLSIASNGKGQLTIASAQTGGTDVRGRCGAPKLSTSNDGKTWSTCGANPNPGNEIGSAGYYIQMAYTSTDKRLVAFSDSSLAPLLRQPRAPVREAAGQ